MGIRWARAKLALWKTVCTSVSTCLMIVSYVFSTSSPIVYRASAWLTFFFLPCGSLLSLPFSWFCPPSLSLSGPPALFLSPLPPLSAPFLFLLASRFFHLPFLLRLLSAVLLFLPPLSSPLSVSSDICGFSFSFPLSFLFLHSLRPSAHTWRQRQSAPTTHAFSLSQSWALPHFSRLFSSRALPPFFTNRTHLHLRTSSQRVIGKNHGKYPGKSVRPITSWQRFSNSNSHPFGRFPKQTHSQLGWLWRVCDASTKAVGYSAIGRYCGGGQRVAAHVLDWQRRWKQHSSW